MSTNLFAQARQRTSGALVEFKAGKMDVEQGMVKPDTRKGKIVMKKGDDGLLHFQWRLRDDKNTLVDDLILFPEEAKWKRVEKIQKSRVYYLDFIGTNRQIFYWLQEPKEDEDEARSKKINELLSGKTQNPTSEQENLFNMFAESRQQQQPRNQPSSQVQMDQLQRVLQSLGAQTIQRPQSQQTNQQSQSQPSQQEPKQEGPGLREVLISDHVCASVLKHHDIVSELIEYLPSDTPKNGYAVCEHIRSPQFQQAVATFDAALSSGQLSGLMKSIGLDPSVGGPFGGTQQFVNALQQQAEEKEKEKKKEEKKEEKKDDDKMEE